MQVSHHLAGAQGHVETAGCAGARQGAAGAGAVDEPELAGDHLEDGDVGLGARAKMAQLRAPMTFAGSKWSADDLLQQPEDQHLRQGRVHGGVGEQGGCGGPGRC